MHAYLSEPSLAAFTKPDAGRQFPDFVHLPACAGAFAQAADKVAMRGCRPLTDDEIARVLAALERDRYHARNHALLVLGCRTGFRISELLSLRLGDVWRDGKVLTEVEVARRYMKGKRRSRRLPLHEEARTALEPWIRELQAAGATGLGSALPLWTRVHAPAQSAIGLEALEAGVPALRALGEIGHPYDAEGIRPSHA
jgi:integrase